MFSEIQLTQSASAAGTIQQQINHCCADRARFSLTSRACDGFVVAATNIPGAFEDFRPLGDPGTATPRLV
jgi:hypothetical protein